MPEKMQLDALFTKKELHRRVLEFTESFSYLRDPHLMSVCRDLWQSSPSEGGLVGELWVEGIFPPEQSGENLAALSQRGVVHNFIVAQLANTGAFPPNRPLYAHQQEAIESAFTGTLHNRPGLVIAAGTGTGKTEAFLLPLLNELCRFPRQVGQTGVRAIILYPLNALVNDQVDRLYKWLRGQSEVTLFHFTSETPEDEKKANRVGFPRFEACRLRTREQARLSPPDVLITNYSMLEYMLCRPQ